MGPKGVKRVEGSAAAVGLEAERKRIADVLARARPPESAGDAVPAAPARGAYVLTQPFVTLPDGKGGLKAVPMGYRDRDVMRLMDAFDLIEVHAARAGLAPPLTGAQVEAGRVYARLSERVASSGIATCRLGGGSGGGGDGVSEARLADAARLARMHRRIGAGWALELRRVRPSDRGAPGAARRNLRDRELVDAVCIEERTPSQVLRRAGWTVDSAHRKRVVRALAAVLDRLHAI